MPRSAATVLVAAFVFGEAASFTLRPALGLAMSDPRAPARGVQVMQLAPTGKVRLGPGRFVMGSTAVDSLRAMALCQREILRIQCDQLSPLFRAELSAHEVSLSAFELDRTEVTVERYRECVRAGVCAAPGFASGDRRFDRPDFPVTHVRWADAGVYCEFRGGRLPTEAEWEYAARGEASREFPWGNVYNPHLCNHGSFAPDDTDGSDGHVGLAPVGAFPDGITPTGIFDLAGNAGEWVADMHDIDEHGFGYPPTPQLNPKPKPSSGPESLPVVRGGSYTDGATWMRAAARGMSNTQRSASIGFRCAYAVRTTGSQIP